jgi:hypothetical protein
VRDDDDTGVARVEMLVAATVRGPIRAAVVAMGAATVAVRAKTASAYLVVAFARRARFSAATSSTAMAPPSQSE